MKLRHVWISNGQKEVGLQMVWISNGIWKLEDWPYCSYTEGAWIKNIGIPITLEYWKCWSSDFQWNHLKSEQNGSKKTTLWKTERHQKTEQKTSIGIPNVFWIPAPTVIWKNNLFIIKRPRLSTFRLLLLLASVLWSSPPLTSLQGQSSDLFEQVNGHSCYSTV